MDVAADLPVPEVIAPDPADVVVGRSTLATVTIPHLSVSRRHALLRLQNNRLTIWDLAGKRTTRVNGKPVQIKVLEEGEVVEFGAVGYVVRGLSLCRIDRTQGLRLDAAGLAIVRGGKTVLTEIDLEIAPGQFVGLLGASGSGKSTLLKCLASLLIPAAGTLRFDSYRSLPANAESYRTMVGYVPQDDIVYPSLTVGENLDYALRLRAGNLSAAERAELVQRTLERLRLTEHAKKRVAVLSGGQRKRVNVGVELLTQPRILFLDEPTSGLDPATELRMMQRLKELAARGVTIVCATHVMENLELFDQVIVLAGGTVAYRGKPQQLRSRFQASSYADLYQRLEGYEPAKQQAPSDTSRPVGMAKRILHGVQLVRREDVVEASPPARLGLPAQVMVQCARGLRLLIRDRMLLALLFGQPILIGLLINLSQIRPDGLKALFLFAVTTAIWLGLTATAREVIRDRRVYVRERLLGITPEGYLLAKVLLFSMVGLVQVWLLGLMLWYANGMPHENQGDLHAKTLGYVVLVLWMAYLGAMLLGLVISTVASSEEVAVACLPLLLLPQLLLTGVATGLEAGSDRTGAFRSLAVLVRSSGFEPRGVLGWVLEGGSLALYSRPALALLQALPRKPELPAAWVIRSVDWLHAALLLAATGTLLVLMLRWREESWQHQA